MTLRDKLFSFDGRLRRQDWWLCTIAASIAYVVFVTVVTMTAWGVDDTIRTPPLAASIGDPIRYVLLTAAFHAPFVFVQAALAAKRAHDRNHSARLVILLVLATAAMSYVPNNGYATLGRMADGGALWAGALVVAGVLNGAASLYLLVVLGFLDGTSGPNRFGPSPKGLSGGAPAFMQPGGLE
ncbi:DUF805 domain-containing protein [Brevundimonas sp.]|uniref:DUF805 domain-containing protein n=1 Tax=Brevundimonas sp. TaxID=1871086 RepID=UPI002CA40296|nr:DUF805 domain-containing protein [Brevundimonas sp.]HWQ85764.1 DUF805 domain-containing protein [Brevundimonas sp.]